MFICSGYGSSNFIAGGGGVFCKKTPSRNPAILEHFLVEISDGSNKNFPPGPLEEL